MPFLLKNHLDRLGDFHLIKSDIICETGLSREKRSAKFHKILKFGHTIHNKIFVLSMEGGRIGQAGHFP